VVEHDVTDVGRKIWKEYFRDDPLASRRTMNREEGEAKRRDRTIPDWMRKQRDD
jgi:hypothetical protein